MTIGGFFADSMQSGILLLAVPLAMIAGVVSFLSPCILPLVPGYLGYISGMANPTQQGNRRRVLTGVALFVLGFAPGRHMGDPCPGLRQAPHPDIQYRRRPAPSPSGPADGPGSLDVMDLPAPKPCRHLPDTRLTRPHGAGQPRPLLSLSYIESLELP